MQARETPARPAGRARLARIDGRARRRPTLRCPAPPLPAWQWLVRGAGWRVLLRRSGSRFVESGRPAKGARRPDRTIPVRTRGRCPSTCRLRQAAGHRRHAAARVEPGRTGRRSGKQALRRWPTCKASKTSLPPEVPDLRAGDAGRDPGSQCEAGRFARFARFGPPVNGTLRTIEATSLMSNGRPGTGIADGGAHGCAAAASRPWVSAHVGRGTPRVRANARGAASDRSATRGARAGEQSRAGRPPSASPQPQPDPSAAPEWRGTGKKPRHVPGLRGPGDRRG